MSIPVLTLRDAAHLSGEQVPVPWLPYVQRAQSMTSLCLSKPVPSSRAAHLCSGIYHSKMFVRALRLFLSVFMTDNAKAQISLAQKPLCPLMEGDPGVS